MRNLRHGRIPVVYVADDGLYFVVSVCPYCGEKHYHFREEGFTQTDCAGAFRRGWIGALVERGYILRLPLIYQITQSERDRVLPTGQGGSGSPAPGPISINNI